jgi:hypothetical protein
MDSEKTAKNQKRIYDKLENENIVDVTTFAFPECAGLKFDQEKVRTDLLSVDSILGTARILTFGAKKYADRNWEKGIDFGRVYGAALRHLFAWFNGEDLDPETGESHLHHASCCVHFLQHYAENYEKYKKFDNRPKE